MEREPEEEEEVFVTLRNIGGRNKKSGPRDRREEEREKERGQRVCSALLSSLKIRF